MQSTVPKDLLKPSRPFNRYSTPGPGSYEITNDLAKSNRHSVPVFNIGGNLNKVDRFKVGIHKSAHIQTIHPTPFVYDRKDYSIGSQLLSYKNSQCGFTMSKYDYKMIDDNKKKFTNNSQYQVDRGFKVISPSPPGYKFYDGDRLETGMYKDIKYNRNPSPVDYRPSYRLVETDLGAKKIIPDNNNYCPPKVISPGPGHYTTPSSIGRQILSTKTSPYTSKFSSSEKSIQLEPKFVVPGPGQYVSELPSLSTIGFTFSKSLRDD